MGTRQVEMVITPDGHLLGRCEGEVAFQAFLGASADLIRSIDEVGPVAELDPASVQCGADENAARQQQLERWVIEAGYRYFPGFGAGPEGDWPPEPSLLVLGINHADAVRVGHRFGQNAIVWGSIGLPAELLDCRSGKP